MNKSDNDCNFSVIQKENDYLQLDEQNLSLAEQRQISWALFGEDHTYEEIK